MTEFAETWQEYSTPTMAARQIGEKWGVARTTLTDWLIAAELWPKTRADLLAENARLRRLLEERDKATDE